MRRLFTIPDTKPPKAHFPVTIDLAGYLQTAELTGTLSLAATDLTREVDAGTSILDVSKSSMGTSQIKVWITGGQSGNTYKVLARIQTDETSTPKDEFGFIVKVKNL